MTFLFGGPIPLPAQTSSVGGYWMVAVAAIILFAIVVAVALVRHIFPVQDKPAAKDTPVGHLRKAA